MDDKKIGQGVGFQNRPVQKLSHIKVVECAKRTNIWGDEIIKERGLGWCVLSQNMFFIPKAMHEEC